MKILMVLDKKFPTDLRVEKEALSLIKAGHKVGLLSIGNYKKSGIADHKGITIYCVAMSKFMSNKMHGLAAMVPWMDRFIAKHVLRIFEKETYDAIHLHDLYLLGAATILKNKVNAFFIGDLHENYVDVLKDYKWSTKFPNRLLISHSKWARKEKEWLQFMDKIIVVNDGMKEKNVKKGVAASDITVVSNSIDPVIFDEFKIDQEIINRFEDYFVLVYVGGFVSNRGLEHVIKGMKLLKDDYQSIRLLLVGDGGIRNELKELAKVNEVEEIVLFEGFQPQETIKSYLISSDIGLVPFKRTEQTDNSSSNKLYQYMYYGLPVLGTDCTSVKKLVEEENCGVIYEAEDHIQFSEEVKKLFEDRELVEKFSKNGKKSIDEKYSWSHEANKLVNLYSELEKA